MSKLRDALVMHTQRIDDELYDIARALARVLESPGYSRKALKNAMLRLADIGKANQNMPILAKDKTNTKQYLVEFAKLPIDKAVEWVNDSSKVASAINEDELMQVLADLIKSFEKETTTDTKRKTATKEV